MTQDTTVPREKVLELAASFKNLMAPHKQRSGTQAQMIRGCLQRLGSPDSRVRREGIDGLRSLAEMLEKDAGSV